MKLSVLCVLAVFCIGGGRLWAAASADPPIPTEDKRDPATHQADINSLVQAETAKLADDNDPDGQTSARQWLEDEVFIEGSLVNTSAAYIDTYCNALNSAFLPLLKKPSTSVRVRINISVVVDTVIRRSMTSGLQPVVLLLLNDKEAAVMIWSERAAGEILRIAIPNAGPGSLNPVLDAVVKSVVNHPSGPLAGQVAGEGYRAINPFLYTPKLNPPGAMLPDLVKYNLLLQAKRLDLYKTGVPDSPDDDTFPSVFVLDQGTFTADAADQGQIMQQAANLISFAGARASQRASNQNGDLIKALNDEAGYLGLLVDANQFPDLWQKLQSVQHLGLASNSTTLLSSTQNVVDGLQAAYPALNLQAPPDIIHATASTTH